MLNEFRISGTAEWTGVQPDTPKTLVRYYFSRIYFSCYSKFFSFSLVYRDMIYTQGGISEQDHADEFVEFRAIELESSVITVRS